MNARMKHVLASFRFKPNFTNQVVKSMPLEEVVDEEMFKAYKTATRGVPHSIAVADPSAVARFD